MFGRSKNNPVNAFQQDLEEEQKKNEAKILELQQRLSTLNAPPPDQNTARKIDQDSEPIDPHRRTTYQASRTTRGNRTIRAIQKRDRNAFFLSLGGILLIILWLVKR